MAISDLVESIEAAAASPRSLQEEERTRLLAACEKLKSKLEHPREAVIRTLLAPHQSIALRLGIDMMLFDAAASLKNEDSEIGIESLSSKMGVDPVLVTRIMRFLAGMGLFEEVAADKFHSMPLSEVYVSESPFTEAVVHMTSQNEIISKLPAYFEKAGYKNPNDAYNGPFQFARDTNLHCFDWLATKPRLQKAFNISMQLTRATLKQQWFDFFPVEEKLRVQSPSATLLVDVGGGVGHQLISFNKKYPALPGKLVVQDIPVVIESIQGLPEPISAMSYDFFTPQPIKGAKAYYLGRVLHDWPDKQAQIILGHIRDAMAPDSILLISESAVPDSGVPLYTASIDLIMMANFAALERTQKQFENLLANSGFDLVGTWTPQSEGTGSGIVLEAIPKKL